jgi:hypothetical protein
MSRSHEVDSSESSSLTPSVSVHLQGLTKHNPNIQTSVYQQVNIILIKNFNTLRFFSF